ncbi:PIN domain-containing protein [candidate division KSB1 bacterium]|nr:PIN domain-containing protein [candidate division KSB1 bacterium]
MNKLFIDADIILDLLLEREPFFVSSSKLFTLIEENKVIAFTTPVILANIYYISARMTNKKIALEAIRKLLTLLKVTAVDEKIMLLAANSDFKDFEDSIQYYAAKSEGIEFLITRNKVDYKITDLTVCTSKEYLSIYHKPAIN